MHSCLPLYPTPGAACAGCNGSMLYNLLALFNDDQDAHPHFPPQHLSRVHWVRLLPSHIRVVPLSVSTFNAGGNTCRSGGGGVFRICESDNGTCEYKYRRGLTTSYFSARSLLTLSENANVKNRRSSVLCHSAAPIICKIAATFP